MPKNFISLKHFGSYILKELVNNVLNRYITSECSILFSGGGPEQMYPRDCLQNALFHFPPG